MSAWHFGDIAREPEYVWHANCPFCLRELTLTFRESFDGTGEDVPFDRSFQSCRQVQHCSLCGWWKASDFRQGARVRDGTEQTFSTWGACASLKQLDLTDISTPLQDVRDYLTAAYDKRFGIDPTLFERTVASVFAGQGYDVLVTGGGGDGGIDVILTRGAETIGVQVKAYRGSIKVGQIRELVGSLYLKGMLSGIFVTTSHFQSGAAGTVENAAIQGQRIELYDAGRFYDALTEVQAHTVRTIDELDYYRCLDSMRELDANKVAISF